MHTGFVFGLFFVGLLFSVQQHIPLLYPLLLGLVAFTALAVRQGNSLTSLAGMMWAGSRKSLIVIKIFVLIGVITAVWRSAGTISTIVYYGIAWMPGDYFLPGAFLLCSLVSFLLGTSFGTAGTIGVVLMVLAQSGHMDISMAAGAIIAGAYFGDRSSPMSSSANLVAVLTGTNLYDNLKNMFRSAWIPFFLSTLAYVWLSQNHPLQFQADSISHEIAATFNLSPLTLLPALVILILGACRTDVKLAMGVSILLGVFLSLWVQQVSAMQLFHYVIWGYTSDHTGFFAGIIQGGGLFSMLNVALIVLISSAYAGIFAGTNLLQNFENALMKLSQRTSPFASLLLSSLGTAAFSCNQTLAILLTYQLAHKTYASCRLSASRLALDLENSVVLLSVVIPWNIAGAVPAAALGADASFIPYAFYLFLVPLWWLLKTRNKD